MKRYGMVIGLRPEKLEEYNRLHAAVWPDVLKMIRHVQHPELLDLPAHARRRSALPVQLLRVHGQRLRRRHGEDGGRSDHPALVGVLQALPAAACRPAAGGVVGFDGRGLSPGLTHRNSIKRKGNDDATHDHLDGNSL